MTNLKCPPEAVSAAEGVPLLSQTTTSVPPGFQVVLDTHLSYEVPPRLSLSYTLPPPWAAESLTFVLVSLIPQNMKP